MLSEDEIRFANAARRIGQRLPRRLVKAGTVMLRHVLIRLSEPVEAEGFQIIDLGDEAGSDGRRHQVIAALGLLRSRDPRRLERMKHGSRRIAIFSTVGSSGEFWTSPWLIVLNSRFVLESSPEEIALVLVHEATHARLKKVGIGYDEAIRHRVERVCVNQEKAFAERLENPEEWLELISRKALDPEYWTNAAKSARREKAFADLVMPPGRNT